jgi:RNA polymerase sigma-70 factor (ECF subfamily)
MIAPANFTASFKLKPTKAKAEADARVLLSRQAAAHDAELVRRFNGGDEAAFVEIMTRHRDRMFAVAFAMLKNRTDAEEIAQDTFIRAHRGLAKFRGDASLATWLHRIALNLARNRYWYFFRRRRHAMLSLDCSFSDDNHATFADLVATEAAGPVREAAAGEFTELVAACMARLGAAPREILTLRNSLDRSYGEIATELGISVGTVKSRIARARENLRDLLAEACPEFGPKAQPLAWFDPIRPAGGVQMANA